MSFTIGQKVTTNRGRNGKGEVEVVAGPDSDGKYVVKDEQGNFHTKPEKGLKALPERTFTATELRTAIIRAYGSGVETDDILEALSGALDVDLDPKTSATAE